MKKLSVFFAISFVFMAVISCSQDDTFDGDFIRSSSTSQTRAGYSNEGLIDFEDFTALQMANPTSYGENLYTSTTSNGVTYPHVYEFSDPNSGYYSEFNYDWGGYYFYNGGIAVSNWNYKSNPVGKSGDWWFSYLNQCSVYSGTDGTHTGAGHNSNNFGVVFGYQDSYNDDAQLPWFEFRSGSIKTNRSNVKMWVCNSSYTYGVITHGNSWSATNPNDVSTSLPSTNGWFKVLAYGYDSQNNATNNGNAVEFYLANYNDSIRINYNVPIGAITSWTQWDLSALGNVARIEFNFQGSDSGPYGLNTPAYVCIDDITFNK